MSDIYFIGGELDGQIRAVAKRLPVIFIRVSQSAPVQFTMDSFVTRGECQIAEYRRQTLVCDNVAFEVACVDGIVIDKRHSAWAVCRIHSEIPKEYRTMRTAAGLWLTGECFERSLRALGEYHYLGEWRFARNTRLVGAAYARFLKSDSQADPKESTE